MDPTLTGARLRAQARWLVARIPIIMLAVVIAALAGYVVTSRQDKTYEARAKLLVGRPGGSGQDLNQLLAAQTVARTWVTLATNRPVLEGVLRELGSNQRPEDLREQLTVTAQPDTALLSIAVQDGDPQRAAAVANLIAQDLISTSAADDSQGGLATSIAQELEATQAQIDSIQSRLDELAADRSPSVAERAEMVTLNGQLVNLRQTFTTLVSLAASGSTSTLTLVEPAVAPELDEAVAPRPLINTILAGMLGLFVALALLFIPRFFDDRLRDPEAIRRSGLTVLGQVNDNPPFGRLLRWRNAWGPRGTRLAIVKNSRSRTAEAYRSIRWNIEFGLGSKPAATLLLAAPTNAHGKTTLAANLAILFAQSGRRVLLVDADLRRPSIGGLFGHANEPGLTDLLIDDPLDIARVVVPTLQPGLQVLPAGRRATHPAELLGTPRMRALLDHMLTDHDLILLDSPPLTPYVDAAVLSAATDGAVIVLDADSDTREGLEASVTALGRANANILGVVLVSFPSGEYETDVGGQVADVRPNDAARARSKGSSSSVAP
jgi:non-specific protein-tyrosine kinase